MRPFKKKIKVDEFVSIIYTTLMQGLEFPFRDMDIKYAQRIEEKEKVAYHCFRLINAFKYGLNLKEEWQYELLNVLLIQRVVEHLDKAKILGLPEADKFLYDRINYYWDLWQKYNTSENWQKLRMAMACMLVYHKPYDEYMSKCDEEIDWSPEFLVVGFLASSYIARVAKGWFDKIRQKYQVVFDNDDTIRHTAYVIRYNELTNRWENNNDKIKERDK